MGQEQRNRAGKGAAWAASTAPNTPAPDIAAAKQTSAGGKGVLSREIALLVTFSLVSIAMAVYLSSLVPRTGETGSRSRGGSLEDDHVGVVIVTHRDDGSKLAVPIRIDRTVSELRLEVTKRLEEGAGTGNDGGGGVGRLTLDGSGAALSPKDILRHLGLTSGGQLRVVVEPMTLNERLAAAKKNKSKDDDEASEASEATPSTSGAGVATQIDAGGDHDDHGRSVGSSKGGDDKGSGGVVPLHHTPQAEMASIRPSPYALVRDGEWKPEEADDERSATRLPDGVFPEPFKYIRVWRSGLTRNSMVHILSPPSNDATVRASIVQRADATARQQCKRIIKDAEKVNEWKGYSAFGDGVKTQDVSVDRLSPQTGSAVNDMLGRLRDYVHKKFIVKLPDLDGAMMVRGGTGKKVAQDDPEHGYDEPVNLKGTPFVIKYNASDASSSLYTHKDNSDVSFILLLSDPEKDFEGGGTYFYDLNENLYLKQGDALVFNGQLVHEAAHITKGLRYVIAGFTLFDRNFLKMKRLGTLATMTTLQR